jgi:hypothetical protein
MGGSNGMLDQGNVNIAAPYTISGKTGTFAPAAGNAAATLVQFGMVVPVSGAFALTPIRVAQIRMKWATVTTPAAAGIAFEIHKGTATVQHTTNGTARAAQRRKTSGYPAIALTETSLYVATGATAITGGDFAAPNAGGTPLDMMVVGAGTTLSGGESIWQPSDLCPITLEAGEGLEVRAVTTNAGTGILLVAFDFLR